MRVVIQRVKQAQVSVDGKKVSRIGKGMVLLAGVEKGDSAETARALALKIANMRIFEDEAGKMNLSIKDIKGEALVVSQFTLCASLKKGHRPSFDPAALPDEAKPVLAEFVKAIKAEGIPVAEGVFGAHMQVEICNDGPVTFVLDS